jgi:undecaprenyl-diphosphatase
VGTWDQSLFDWINHWPQSWNLFLKFFSIALNLPVVKIFFGLLIIAMIVRGEKTRKAVLLALISIGIANTITNVAKEGFPMKRPFQDREFAMHKKGDLAMIDRGFSKITVWPDKYEGVILRVGHSDSRGTASAHSANMAALAFAFCYFLGWWGTPWIAVALLTGISRVYTGAHYPSQVLLGWACGIFAAFVVIKTWEAFVKRRTGVQSGVEDERPELA